MWIAFGRVLDGACRCRVTWGEADVASTCCGTCRRERGGGRERQGRRRSAGVSTPPHQRTPARARTHARHLQFTRRPRPNTVTGLIVAIFKRAHCTPTKSVRILSSRCCDDCRRRLFSFLYPLRVALRPPSSRLW